MPLKKLWSLKKRSMKSNKFQGKSFLPLLLLLSLFSCDFTPKRHKRILEAQKLLLNQRYQESIKIYQDILQADPEPKLKVKIYYQLGEIYSINLGKNETAVEYYNKVKETTEDPLWLVKAEEKLGDLNFVYLKDYFQSEKSYARLSNFTPKLKLQDFYQYRWALSLTKQKKFEQALKKFQKIMKINGHEHQVDSLYQIGMAHFEQKEWKQAIAYWNQYIKREKRKDYIVEAKFLMANAYETLELLKKAYNLYYSILGEYPNTEVIQSSLMPSIREE